MRKMSKILCDVGKNSSEISLASYLLSDRQVFLKKEIDEVSANSIVEKLLFLDSQSEEPITFYINSPGGSVPDGLAIYDAMMMCKSPIITVGIGQVCSAASLLLMAGTERYITRNAAVMLHQSSAFVVGKYSDLQSYADYWRKEERRIYQLYSKHTGQSVKKIEKDLMKDFWLNAEEAVKYNLCDGIKE